MGCTRHRFRGWLVYARLCQWKHDSSSSKCWMSIQRPTCFFNIWSSCSTRLNYRRRDCLRPPLVARCDAAQASPAHPTPSAGLAARNQLPPYYAKKRFLPLTSRAHWLGGWPVGLLRWRVSRACQLSQQTILTTVNIGFESNGPAASSIAALLAPAAQTSGGETACSCLITPRM